MRGRFQDRRNNRSGLPPELVSLLAVERKRRSWRRYLPLWGSALAVGLVVGAGPILFRSMPAIGGNLEPRMVARTIFDRSLPAEGSVTSRFGFCHTGGGTNCVVDGDTIWFQGQKVRIADIDAPETHDFRCPEEKALGDRATQRLIELVNSGSVDLQPIDRDEDVYGRKLRIVLVNGTSVGDTLVSEGLARYYEGGRKPWC